MKRKLKKKAVKLPFRHFIPVYFLRHLSLLGLQRLNNPKGCEKHPLGLRNLVKRLTKGRIRLFILLLVIFIIFLVSKTYEGKRIKSADLKKEKPETLEIISEESIATETARVVDFDYIVITETPVPTPTRTPTPKPTITPTPVRVTSDELNNLFKKYSQEYSISEELLKKIAYCESKFNPQASNGTYGGLYQFSVGAWTTARRAMNADQNPQLRFSPEESIRTAAFKIATGGLSIWPNCSR